MEDRDRRRLAAAVEAADANGLENSTRLTATMSHHDGDEGRPGRQAAAKVEIEAFDLSTVNLKTQIQQTKPEIKDIGDLLEASGVQAGAASAALGFGFYADEAVDPMSRNAMDDRDGQHHGGSAHDPAEDDAATGSFEVIAPSVTGREMIDGLQSQRLQRSLKGVSGLTGGIQSSFEAEAVRRAGGCQVSRRPGTGGMLSGAKHWRPSPAYAVGRAVGSR